MKYPLQIIIPSNYIRNKVSEFLLEDAPQGDITGSSVIPEGDKISAEIIVKEDLVFAGEQILPHFFKDPFIVDIFVQDGKRMKTGDVIAKITGQTRTILARERVLLNLLQRVCGIATLTRKFVDIANPYKVKILDTRKTTPGLRFLEKYAVAVGGGQNHRLDLSSGILIKDNHIKAVGNIDLAVEKMREMNYGLPIELEAENKEQIIQGLRAGVDGFLLDNMTPAEVKDSVEFIKENSIKDIFIEASGGINLETVGEYVKTGVNALSVGALTHSPRSSDIHMEFIQ